MRAINAGSAATTTGERASPCSKDSPVNVTENARGLAPNRSLAKATTAAGRKVVRIASIVGRRRNFFALHFAGLAGAFGGVHEDDSVEMADHFRQLGRELMHAEDLDFGGGKFRFQSVGGAPRNSVIRSQGISIGDDQNSRHSLQRFQEHFRNFQD